MKQIFVAVLAVVLSLKEIPSIGQDGKQRAKFVTIAGEITGNTSMVYSIELIFNSHFVKRGADEFDSTAVFREGKQFHFKFPLKRPLGKIFSLVIYYNRYRGNPKEQLRDYDLLDDFVVEQGDNVHFNINIKDYGINGIHVSGRGGLKYESRANNNLTYKQFLDERIAVAQRLSKKKEWLNPSSLDSIHGTYVSFKNKMLAALDSCKNALTRTVFDIMRADIVGHIEWLWESQIRDYYLRVDSLARKQVEQFYYTHQIPNENYPDPVFWLTYWYTDYLFQKELTRLCFDEKVTVKSNFTDIYHDLYYSIKNHYQGELKERLLFLMLTDPLKNQQIANMTRDKADSFFSDALSVIKTSAFRDELQSANFYKVRKGNDAYPFDLVNANGQTTKLSDLSGKVVLLDMWFTGCTGCAIFAEKAKKEILPLLRDNKEFAVVSICTDSESAMWVNSMKTQLYSEPENINLHLPIAKNAFSNNPMIKFYGIEGLPFILLIDKQGKIVQQLKVGDKSVDIVSIINQSIDKK